MAAITVNGVRHELEVEDGMPLLWVLRDVLNLTGTKFGCGVAACGACTVLVGGKAERSCILPVGAVPEDASVTTIEGLSPDRTHPLQQAWIARQVPQCGYCQSGMILAVASLLRESPAPTDREIEDTVTNICRCGTYPRIREAIREVVAAPIAAGGAGR